MHRVAFTLLAITALAVGGCSDDDDENGTGGAGGSTGGTGGSTGGSGGSTGGSGGSTGGTGGTAGTGTGGTAGTGTGGTAGSSAAAEVIDCTGQTIAQTIDIPNAVGFDPATQSVAVGDIVKWDNSDVIAHTVTSGTGGVTPAPDGKFNSGNIAAGASVCIRFAAAGSYPYYCSIHPNMMGTITVTQ